MMLQKLMDPAEIQNILRNESTIDHMNEATVFFYVWAVVASTGGGYVERFLMSMVKAWGALGFLLPLVYNVAGASSRGGNDMFANMDKMAWGVIVAMFVDEFCVKYLNKIYDAAGTPALHETARDIGEGIMRSAACATGYFGFQAAFRGNHMAGFFGAMLAVIGDKVITKGVGAFNVAYSGAGSARGKLAVFGGMALWFMMEQMKFSNAQARAGLAFMNVAQIWLDFDPAVAAVADAVNGARKKLKSM